MVPRVRHNKTTHFLIHCHLFILFLQTVVVVVAAAVVAAAAMNNNGKKTNVSR
jgi:hypothetical protein